MKSDMGIQLEGIEAEQWFLGTLIEKGIKCFQPDAISLENGKYVLNEVKHQEHFKGYPGGHPLPSWNGHGLPLWQIKARINFFLVTGIRCRLTIREKGTNIVYSQWLDILEQGEFFDTQGENPRRVYKIGSFKKEIHENING